MKTEQIIQTVNKFYMPVFNRHQISFSHGKGCKLYADGKEYLDFAAGIAVNCLGYGDSELTKAIAEQASKLIHISSYFYTDVLAEYVSNFLENSDFEKIFLCNSGSEANEGAIKLVRKYYYNLGIKKPIILTALNSFHGRTLATTAATGQTKYSEPYAPLPEGFKHIPYNDITAFMNAIDKNTGAVMLEIIQGEGGIIQASSEYIEKIAEICKQNKIFLIIDEVQTGMGRTGKMFGYQHYNFVPDIITLAKGIAGGVPMGAFVARGDIANAFKSGDHGNTFGGNPLACSAGIVVLNRLKNGLLEHVQETGEYFLDQLKSLKKYSFVKDIRGKGLLIGLELEESVKSKDIIDKMQDNCYIIIGCGKNALRFCPPLIITKAEIDLMINQLDKVFSLIK